MVTKNIYGYEIPCKWEHDCNTVMKLDNVNFDGQTGLRLIQGDKSIDIVLPKEIAVAIAGACENIIAAEQRIKADECEEPCELGGVHEFAPSIVICSKCGTRRLC